ncbi:hypothetical protein Tco_0585695 [Tanacetum coccineum]
MYMATAASSGYSKIQVDNSGPIFDDDQCISFAKPEFLKKAQRANPRLYDIGCYNDNLALMLAPDSDETIRLDKERRSKLSDLIRPFVMGHAEYSLYRFVRSTTGVKRSYYYQRVSYVEGFNHYFFSLVNSVYAVLEVAFRKSLPVLHHDLKGADLLTGSRGNKFAVKLLQQACFTSKSVHFVIPPTSRKNTLPYHSYARKKPSVKSFTSLVLFATSSEMIHSIEKFNQHIKLQLKYQLSLHLENIIITRNQCENAQFDNDEFIKHLQSTWKQERGETSFLVHVDSSNMHTFYQHHPSAQRWTKVSNIEQSHVESFSISFRTRRQLETDGEICMFALNMSRTEPKNIKKAWLICMGLIQAGELISLID